MKDIDQIFENNTLYNYSASEIVLKENLVEGNLKAELVVFYSGKLEPNQRAFLMKILSAVKHDINNTLLISNETKILFKQIVKAGFAKKSMYFGSTRQEVGINLTLKRYKTFSIQKIECLFIDGIDLLIEDKRRKSALWNTMKEMYA